MLVLRSLLSVAALAALALDAGAAAPPRARYDIHGDRLPPGAIARLGKSSDAKAALGTVAFLPDGGSLLSVDGRIVRRWGARTGKLLSTKTFRDTVLAVAPDGNLLFESDKGKVWVGDSDGGKEIRRFEIQGKVGEALFSPDGKRLVTSRGHQLLQLHDTITGKLLRRVVRNDSRWEQFVFPLGFTSDGKRLVYSEMSATGERRIRYNPITGRYLGELRLDSICVLDAVTGKDLYHFRTTVGDARFCSVERHLLAFRKGKAREDSSLRLFHPTSAQVIRPIVLQPAKDFNEVALSPDHRYVACRANRTEVVLFEVPSGKEIQRFPPRTGAGVSPSFSSYSRPSMTFSPDGRRLCCLTDDHTGLIWDVTGRTIDGRHASAAPSARELESLWSDLSSTDALVAHRAVWTLVACPQQSIAFIGRRLTGSPTRTLPLTRLIDDLGSERLQTRETATSSLAKLGVDAEPALLRALASSPDLEVYRRVERLLQQSVGPLMHPDRLRESRSVHVLEQIGTPAARVLLRRTEGLGADTRLGEEAKSALQRLARR